ncbi:MAG: ABC transporter permease [Defluviicoccus sp.]|nr:ABC transporter permease [Defluviicoccus sp.]MDE0384348.1 ABC transporter permease [Defluviicoccus sp.]
MARIDRSSGGAAPALGDVVREKGLWLFEALGPFALIGAAVIAWEVTALQKAIDPFLLPAFSTVVMRIFDDLITGKLLLNAALTLYRALVAFGLAASIGVLLGILMARVVSVGWFFDPIVSIGLPAPKIALLPVFMLWFGLFDLAKIMMVAFSASFQIIATTWAATRSVEREIIWSARSLGATERQILWQVILPTALPQILTGLQIAMPISLIVVLVTEMVMGGEGLGSAMLRSARFADSPGVFAGIIEIGLLGFAVIRTMEVVRRRLLSWHQEAARDETTV